MLSGEGMSNAVNIANQVGGFNEQKINDLYAQRKDILGQLTETSSAEFGTGWEGDDGKIYFSPDDVPEGTSIVGKAGTRDPNIPTQWVKSQTDAVNAIKEADTQLAKITNVINNVPDSAWSGWFGRGEASLRNILGSQDAVQAWRTNVSDLLVSGAIQNLPPGVASDLSLIHISEPTRPY